MTTPKTNHTTPKFSPEGIQGLLITMGQMLALIVIGIFVQNNQQVPPFTNEVGKFFQVVGVGALISLAFTLPNALANKSGKYTGACPYCQAETTLENITVDGYGGIDCAKCKNRIMLRSRKFYQIERPAPLDRKFSAIKEGIGLVIGGTIVACFLPIAVVVGIFSTIFTFNLFGLIGPIALCLLLSLGMHLRGIWLCSQAPDRFGGKRWITATTWLDGISLGMVILQAIFMRNDVGVFLVQLITIASQISFLLYLEKLSVFVNRFDLAKNFQDNKEAIITMFVMLVSTDLPLPFVRPYEGQILFLVALGGAGFLFGYLNNLRNLQAYLGRAITA